MRMGQLFKRRTPEKVRFIRKGWFQHRNTVPKNMPTAMLFQLLNQTECRWPPKALSKQNKVIIRFNFLPSDLHLFINFPQGNLLHISPLNNKEEYYKKSVRTHIECLWYISVDLLNLFVFVYQFRSQRNSKRYLL